MHTAEQLAGVRPSHRQLAMTDLNFYAFVHYSINTYTDKEWGDGTESPALFRPTDFSPDQWAAAIRDAGMKGLILTCKHHDGFCLWPSRYTEHSVKNSPFGKDVVAEVSRACHEAGLAFGIYLSPWDRHEASYGQGKAYDDYFVSQLTELLTGYGPVFAVWFDGACGEGPNGKKQYYDWDRYYETVRRLQPEACMCVCGPDVRWCGNEAGATRPSEWSVVSKRMLDTERIASLSQKADDTSFRMKPLRARDLDLGSREALKDEPELIWYPAEVNTSIRPGWFYHTQEDSQVKSLACLQDIYLRSAGGNANFLLNIPPMPSGRLSPYDVERLHEFGEWLRAAFRDNLTENAQFSGDENPGHPLSCLAKDDKASYAAPVETPVFTVSLPEKKDLSYLVLREAIWEGQRIEGFTVEALDGGAVRTVYTGTTVGNRKIVPLHLSADAIRIRITSSRLAPVLSFAGLY